jgi:hypothetical protein
MTRAVKQLVPSNISFLMAVSPIASDQHFAPVTLPLRPHHTPRRAGKQLAGGKTWTVGRNPPTTSPDRRPLCPLIPAGSARCSVARPLIVAAVGARGHHCRVTLAGPGPTWCRPRSSSLFAPLPPYDSLPKNLHIVHSAQARRPEKSHGPPDHITCYMTSIISRLRLLALLTHRAQCGIL